MSCCVEKSQGKTIAVLGFRREELLYDIRNIAYIEGHVMPPEGEHSRHMVLDVGEEGNVDRVTRVLSMAIAQCREMLYPFTKRDMDMKYLDDKFKEQPVYGIVMNVPEDFSQTTLNLLEKMIHEYLVYRAVSDWLSMTKPDKAEAWLLKAKMIEDELRVALHSRKTRTRITPRWL